MPPSNLRKIKQKKPLQVVEKILKHLTIFMVMIVLVTTAKTYAQDVFNPNLIFRDTDLYSLPANFSSPKQIQIFLESRNSILASTSVNPRLYTGGTCQNVNGQQVCYNQDPITKNAAFPSAPPLLQPMYNLQPYLNSQIPVSEFIWLISRTDMSSGCDLQFQLDICYQNSLRPINPGFILAMIQKESRLVYGPCARPDADTNPACAYSSPNSIQKLNFRLDRATGYYCFETSNKQQSCWDENPNWLSYKGLFRQVYHMVRRLRLLEQMCIRGGVYSFKNSRGDHKVGSTVMVDGTPTILLNGITCALYVYTPHFWGNNLHWLVMKDLNALYDFRDEYELPENYTPKPIKSL